MTQPSQTQLRRFIAWLRSLLHRAKPKPMAKTNYQPKPTPGATAKPAPKPTSAPKPKPPPKLPAALGSKPPVPSPRRFGIDVAWGTITMAALKKARVTFVIRYLSNDSSKNLHDDYADELLKAGIDTVVVWETTADRAKQGYQAGRLDAKVAYSQALACGMPKDRPIYFAVDFDARGSEVAPYFRGCASVLGKSGAGIYGGYRPVLYMLGEKVVNWGWQTYAWSEGKWVASAQLFQYSNSHKVGGVEVDYDHSAAVADFGQWRA